MSNCITFGPAVRINFVCGFNPNTLTPISFGDLLLSFDPSFKLCHRSAIQPAERSPAAPYRLATMRATDLPPG